jgi:hypothetical protein
MKEIAENEAKEFEQIAKQKKLSQGNEEMYDEEQDDLGFHYDDRDDRDDFDVMVNKKFNYCTDIY